MMKKKTILIVGIITLILVAAIAYTWATGIMDSLFAFRSPLANDPPISNTDLGDPLTDRLVIILVDALREDTSLDPEVMPFLDTLRQQSAWATMNSLPPSYSAPTWTVLMTGAWTDINDGQPANPPDNDNVRAFTQEDVFELADNSGLNSAVSGYTWLEGMLLNSGVDAGFYTVGEDNAADVDVLNAFTTYIKSNEYQLMLIHLDQVDYSGHYEGGPAGPNWNPAATRVDTMIEEIVSLLDLDHDTVLVVSDHGHIDRGGHGGQDPITLIEPFILAGPAVIPGNYEDIQMIDVAPTISVLMGTSLPGSNQGRVLTEMLDLSSNQEQIIFEALGAQQLQLLKSYQVAIGVDQSTDMSDGVVDAMNISRSQRLIKERILRGQLAIVLVLLPLYLFIKMNFKNKPWLIGGAVLYILIFNLIYAVIIGKTYSLSSVYSADDLIFTTAIYSAISLMIAWLATMLITRSFSDSPSSSARTTLGFTTTTLYFLLLPILWNYFLNGYTVTWTLPHFASMFMGFLSILQSLFVSVIGLLLIGVSALVAKFVPNKIASQG